MRRALLALGATAAGPVLLLGCKSQPTPSLATPPAAVSGPTVQRALDEAGI